MPKNLFITLSAALFLSGCQTYQGQATRTRQVEDRRIEKENQRRMTGRLETLEMEMGRISRELDNLRQSLEVRCSAIEHKSEKDKRELIARLTVQLEKLIKQATPAPIAPAASGGTAYGYEHVVQRGETLSTIAKAYNVTTKALINANKIKNANQLSIGQKLFVPE